MSPGPSRCTTNRETSIWILSGESWSRHGMGKCIHTHVVLGKEITNNYVYSASYRCKLYSCVFDLSSDNIFNNISVKVSTLPPTHTGLCLMFLALILLSIHFLHCSYYRSRVKNMFISGNCSWMSVKITVEVGKKQAPNRPQHIITNCSPRWPHRSSHPYYKVWSPPYS